MSQKSATNFDQAFGRRLRDLRKSRRISQTDLGRALGISFQQVQKYEKGVNRISLARALKSADILETDLLTLAGINGAALPTGTLRRDLKAAFQSVKAACQAAGITIN